MVLYITLYGVLVLFNLVYGLVALAHRQWGWAVINLALAGIIGYIFYQVATEHTEV